MKSLLIASIVALSFVAHAQGGTPAAAPATPKAVEAHANHATEVKKEEIKKVAKKVKKNAKGEVQTEIKKEEVKQEATH